MTSAILTKQQVLELYLRDNDKLDQSHKAEEIVRILGGIDNILKIALSSDDFQLNNDQLTQIRNVISTASSIQHQQNSDLESSETHWTYYFDKSNTRIFNQYKAYTFGYICSDIEFHDLYDPDS